MKPHMGNEDKQEGKGKEVSAKENQSDVVTISGNISRKHLKCVIHFRLLVHVLSLSVSFFLNAEIHTANVSVLINAGRHNEATQTLQRLAKSTQDIEQLIWIYHQLGEIHYNYTHEYPEALTAYNQIIQIKAKTPATDDLFLAYIKKGDTYRRMGKSDDAIHTYQTLVDHFPPTHFAHQTGLQKIRNIRTALEILQVQHNIVKTYRGTPSAVEAQFRIAEVYRGHHQLNQPEQAIDEYEVILRQYPSAKNAPEAQWRIGNLRHVVLNQPNLAMEAYRKVPTKYPSSNFAADALFQIARIHEKRGQYEQSATILESLGHRYPDFWNMHAVFFWLGVCYEQSHEYRRSLQAFETLLHVYLPNLDPAYFGQIGKHNQSHSQIEIELQTKIRKLEAELPEVEWKKVEDLLSASDYRGALTLARQLIADAPQSEYAEKARTQLYSITAHASIQNLQFRIHNFPSTEASHGQFKIGTIYERKLQDYTKAITAYRKLMGDFPKSPWAAEALYRIGLIYLEHLNDTEMAIQSHQGLIEQYPLSPQTMMANFQLGEIYRTLHRYDEALQAYQTTVAYPERDSYLAEGYKDSFADRARFRIGRVHYEDGRHNDAQLAFEEFIESRPQSPRLAAAYVYLARMNYDSGDLPHAAQAYEEAIKLVGDSQTQAEMVVTETHHIESQGSGRMTVLQRLEDLCKLVNDR